jgi:hypothetical protein
MTVRELIKALKALPPEAEVSYLWDGEPRSEVVHAYLAKAGGRVVLADIDKLAATDEGRPATAPSALEDPTWRTPR